MPRGKRCQEGKMPRGNEGIDAKREKMPRENRGVEKSTVHFSCQVQYLISWSVTFRGRRRFL